MSPETRFMLSGLGAFVAVVVAAYAVGLLLYRLVEVL